MRIGVDLVNVREIGGASLGKVMHKRHFHDQILVALSLAARDEECQENDAHHVLEIARHRHAEVLDPCARDIAHRTYFVQKFEVTICHCASIACAATAQQFCILRNSLRSNSPRTQNCCAVAYLTSSVYTTSRSS